MKSNLFTTAMAILALGAAVAVTATTADAKSFGFGGPHHFRHGGFGLAAGVLGAVALGAAATSAGYSSGCYYVSKRIYDDYGYFVGYRNVQVCD
jgi:hypothetical protein